MTKILVMGANGALGKEVLQSIGPERAVAVSRRESLDHIQFTHVRLGEDGTLPEDALDGVDAIVNAAGRVNASRSELHEANVVLPLLWAQQARDGGVAKFVQVSSFSVYGDCELIGNETPIAPKTEYGRSKAEGDRRLLALARLGFAVECVRLPFLFGVDQPGLVAPLMAAFRKLPAWPVSSVPTQRSMMTYSDAGLILAEAAGDLARGGITHAADPTRFDFAMFARVMREEANAPVRLLSVHSWATTPLRWLAPSIYRRLFLSSTLCGDANLAEKRMLPHGIERFIRQIVRADTLRRRAEVDSARPSD